MVLIIMDITITSYNDKVKKEDSLPFLLQINKI